MTTQPSATPGGALRRGLAALGALLLSAGMATALAAPAQAQSSETTTTTTTTTTATDCTGTCVTVDLAKRWLGGSNGGSVDLQIQAGELTQGATVDDGSDGDISATFPTEGSIAVTLSERASDGSETDLADYDVSIACFATERTDGKSAPTPFDVQPSATPGSWTFTVDATDYTDIDCTITNSYRDVDDAVVAQAAWSNQQGGSVQLWFEWPNCNLAESDEDEYSPCDWPTDCPVITDSGHCATDPVAVEAGQSNPFAWYVLENSDEVPNFDGLEIHQRLTGGGAYETPTALLSGLGAAGLTLTGPVCTTNNECYWTVNRVHHDTFRPMPRAFIPGPTIRGLLVTVTNIGVPPTRPSSSTPIATTTSPAPTTSMLPTTSSAAASTTSVQVLGVSQEEPPAATEVIVPLASTGAPVLALGSLAALLLLAGSALLVVPALRRRRSTHD